MLSSRIAYYDEELDCTNFIEFEAFTEKDAEERALAIVNRGVVHAICEDFDFIKCFMLTYKHRGRLWATSIDAKNKLSAQLELLKLQTYGCFTVSVSNECET
jgi:hypothetical protein